MGTPIKLSSTSRPLVFLMVDSSDHVTGKTGLTVTVTLRKVGGSFASPAGAVTEIAHGWYQVAGNATDSNTLGPLLLHATGTGADPCDDCFEVVTELEGERHDANVTHFGGSAGTFAGGIPAVNATQLAGTAYASADLSATMKASINTEADTAIADVGLTTTITGRIDAAVSTRLASGSYTAPPSAAAVASQVRTELTTELGRIDAAVTTRMATYTQPTGFLAATFPTTVASTTNITGGTITTVTNLTNLPAITAGWLTASGIADGAITDAKIAAPAEAAGVPTTILAMIRRVFERGGNKRTRNRTTGVKAVRNAADAGNLESSTQSTSGVTDTEGAVS